MKVPGISGSMSIAAAQARPAERGSAKGFVDLLARMVDIANDRQLKAEQGVKDFAAGKIENVHEVMLAETEADLSFKMLLQTRNKLVEAYKEIMRMQI